MSRITLDYDETTGEIKDAKGMIVYHMMGVSSFEPEKHAAPVLELIKQGVTPDEIIKLRNNDLL